jgi:hypothetical protein
MEEKSVPEGEIPFDLDQDEEVKEEEHPAPLDVVDDSRALPLLFLVPVWTQMQKIPWTMVFIAIISFFFSISLFFIFGHSSYTGVPYLSETGVKFPESMFFRAGLTVLSVLMIVFLVGIRSTMVRLCDLSLQNLPPNGIEDVESNPTPNPTPSQRQTDASHLRDCNAESVEGVEGTQHVRIRERKLWSRTLSDLPLDCKEENRLVLNQILTRSVQALVVGVVSAVSLFFVGAVNLKECFVVHILAACIFFICAFIALLLLHWAESGCMRLLHQVQDQQQSHKFTHLIEESLKWHKRRTIVCLVTSFIFLLYLVVLPMIAGLTTGCSARNGEDGCKDEIIFTMGAISQYLSVLGLLVVATTFSYLIHGQTIKTVQPMSE